MATIDFHSYRIESYTEGWAVGTPKTRINKKQQREIFLHRPKYFPRLEGAVRYVAEQALRDSDAANAKELLAELKELRQEVQELLEA